MFEEMKDIFSTTLKLARIRMEYYELYGFREGTLGDLTDYMETDDYKKYKEKEDELINFLNSLDFEQIKVIQSIMYLGRDRDYKEDESYQKRYDSMRKYFDDMGWNDKKIEIGTIVEKLPLDMYLENGFKILNIVI